MVAFVAWHLVVICKNFLRCLIALERKWKIRKRVKKFKHLQTFVILQFQLCGSASYYNNPQDQLDLVFAGPLKMKIGLEKVDTFDKYTFEYQRIPASQAEAMTKMIAKWDTPGSSINRLSKINLVLDESTLNFVKIDVEIPVRKVRYIHTSTEIKWNIS